jgi:hypothetical protein
MEPQQLLLAATQKPKKFLARKRLFFSRRKPTRVCTALLISRRRIEAGDVTANYVSWSIALRAGVSGGAIASKILTSVEV